MKLTKHDEFVRKCLLNLEVAKDFLGQYLPVEIKDKCNLDSLAIVPGSYIDGKLKKMASDVVYSLKTKSNSQAYIYTLVEHQSSEDSMMSFRILRYQVAIMQQHLDKHSKEDLPLVFPLVIYNGTKSPYPYPTTLKVLFNEPELFANIGLGNFMLNDLTILEDDEIIQHKKVALLEMLAKHIRDRDFISAINYIVEAFKIAQTQQIEHSLIQGAMHYLLSGREKEELNILINELLQQLPDYGDELMTYAEELRREGKQEGKREVINEIAKKMLKEGEPAEKISRLLGIPLDKLQKH